MMYGYDPMGWWGYAGMGIGIVLVCALVIGGIIAVVTFATGDQRYPQTPPPEAPSAEQLLAARFARGEISETEYRERLAVLHDPSRR